MRNMILVVALALLAPGLAGAQEFDSVPGPGGVPIDPLTTARSSWYDYTGITAPACVNIANCRHGIVVDHNADTASFSNFDSEGSVWTCDDSEWDAFLCSIVYADGITDPLNGDPNGGRFMYGVTGDWFCWRPGSNPNSRASRTKITCY